MEIGKPQINIPKVAEDHKLEQASSDLQAHTPGFAQEDLLEIAPDNNGHASVISAETFGQPEVPHPSIHGPHFELGRELRDALAPPDNGLVDDIGDEFEDGFPLFAPPDGPAVFDTTVKEAVENVARIVDNLKDRIQDSVESTIHPFEDWFD